MLFLSYAEEDRETAGKIARWLEDRGFKVFRWEDPQRRGGRFIKQTADELWRSADFLAVLSPNYLASDWCNRETELALQREQHLQASEPDRGFIRVLKILPTPTPDARFLAGYDWLDLTNPGDMEAALSELADRLRPEDKPETVSSAQADAGRAGEQGARLPRPAGSDPALPFRNRDDELEKVMRGLTNASGPHFWLVIAPPQLGKSWFLRRVGADPALAAPADWVTRFVDLKEQPADICSDPAGLLALLFGLAPPVTTEPDTLRRIAQGISRSRRPHLCLLDSVELLDRPTADTVRFCLGQVYRLVRENAPINVRLAVIVASRREDGWRGVTPAPRLSQLTLTEFGVDVVEQALRDLAEEMDRTIAERDYARYALLVHRLTEGLPALLVRCLEWIKEEEWYGLEGLETPELFERFATPYIVEDLFALDSLFPGHPPTEDESLLLLTEAFRVLAPYRLFTQSHLRHHLESDVGFRTAMNGQRWRLEHLWKSISGTALLSRLLDEPWREIHPAIRRLLHRHYYESQDQRATVHNEARKFVEIWADKQSGKEQVIGLVESLWHEATVLRLLNPGEMERSLSESARALSRALRPSNAFTVEELQGYAAERMRNDEELEEAVSIVDGLFTRLIEIVASSL